MDHSITAVSGSEMGAEEKLRIVRSIGEECVQEEELLNLLANKPQPICYDRIEPSGRMHIAQGVMKTINVNKLTSAGCKVKILIADWFAWLNNEKNGDLKKFEVFGQYMIDIWKAMGMNLDQVEFLWSSKEINSRIDEYLHLVLDIARRTPLRRVKSCCQIMGDSDGDDLTAAQILYPLMQCADIFFFEADICQLGLDQREVNVLAREYSDIEGKIKPIILSHHMLPGLKGQEKMSKSDPNSCIFMDDEEVSKKINDVVCPPNVVEGNLCLEYIKYIVLPWFNEFKVDRSDKHGGNKIYTSIEELNADYESGQLHPADLKSSLKTALNNILQPVRDHIENNPVAKDLCSRVKKDLCSRVKKHDKKQKHSISSSLSCAMDHSLTLTTPSSSSSSITVSGSEMSAEEKFRIVRSIGEECIQDEELLNLLAKKPQPICYDGFEPSGRMHIAQGVMKTINVNKLTSAGCKVKILIADYFALLNNKMNGDLKKIEVVGQSMIEIWKAVGMNMDQVEFLWSSKEIKSRADEYLPLVFDIGKKNSVKRVKRCCQIMGRSDGDDMPAAQILYPLMQCADIFFLEADICQLGMDQRKVNVLAREYCDDIKRKNKPIILSHHMLPGLNGQEKMSKSDPESSIFMDDDEKDVIRKINDAHCPPNIVEGNPCLEYIKYIVLPWFNELKVDRSDEHGGNKIYTSIEVLNADYESGQLHPADLKTSLSNALNKILQPVRDHKENDPVANDLFTRVKGFMESMKSNNVKD